MIKALVLLFPCAACELVLSDGLRHSLFCNYQRTGAFGLTSQTEPVKFDGKTPTESRCSPIYNAQGFVMDPYVLLGLVGLPVTVPSGHNPCDLSTYLDPNFISGKYAVMAGAWKLVCVFLIDDPDAPRLTWGSGTTIRISKPAKYYSQWLEENNVLGQIIVMPGNSAFHAVTSEKVPDGLFDKDYVVHSEMLCFSEVAITAAVATATISWQTALYNITEGVADGLYPVKDEYPNYIFYHTQAFQISFFVIAFPVHVVLLMYAMLVCYRIRRNWTSLTYVALLFEGVFSTVFRILRVVFFLSDILSSSFHCKPCYLDSTTHSVI